MIGLDLASGRYNVSPEPVNQSLGAAETKVLRRFNEAIGRRKFPWEIYAPLVMRYLATEFTARHQSSIELPDADFEWARQWTADTSRFIEESGYHVVGDLAELRHERRRAGAGPEAVSVDDQLTVAISGMALLAKYVAADDASHTPLTRGVLQAQLKHSGHECQQHVSDLPATADSAITADRPTSELIKRFLIELSTRVRWLEQIYRAYRAVRATLQRKQSLVTNKNERPHTDPFAVARGLRQRRLNWVPAPTENRAIPGRSSQRCWVVVDLSGQWREVLNGILENSATFGGGLRAHTPQGSRVMSA